jgi:SAM-dependent methyltransferase
MADLAPIYDLMRGSELNERVGGADPEQVGRFCHHNITLNMEIKPGDRILDFGCGIGRVLLQVANKADPSATIVGMDIMPEVIEFCRDHVTAAFPNVSFELIEGANTHYDKFIDRPAARSKREIIDIYGASFSKAYAFSVFTHVDQPDFPTLLSFVKDLLADHAEFLFTCFILTAYSRAAIRNQTATFKFGDMAFESNEKIFVGNRRDRLAFIAYDIGFLEDMIHRAGFVIAHVHYGAWRGCGFGSSLQDVVVVRKPVGA